MSNLTHRIEYVRNLPHIQPPGATLFVTYRLVGSIPQQVMQRLLSESEQIDLVLAAIEDDEERAERAEKEHRGMFGRWDAELDKAAGGHLWLRDRRIAQIVVDSLHYLDDAMIDLDTYCLMSNHVHVILTPLPAEPDNDTYHALQAIMHKHKRFTAIRANRVLNREGQFWQHESYDHVVRDEAELQRIRSYVLNNPVKAGLAESWDEWPWSYCKWTAEREGISLYEWSEKESRFT